MQREESRTMTHPTITKELAMSKRCRDLAGMRFGRLLVKKFNGVHGKGKSAKWIVQCDCGTEKSVWGIVLTRGEAVSCGCYFKEVASKSTRDHGLSKTKTAGIWRGMIGRCKNPKDTSFKNYGARGITICERWMDFLNFLADMGECPEGYSIERDDNEKGYFPENCKWIPRGLQARNTRNALKYEGKPLAQISEETGINYATLRSRFKKHGTPFIESLKDNTP